MFFFIFFQTNPITDVAILFTAIFYVINAFGVIFASCEFSQSIINAFDEIGDVTGQYHWYLFSQKVKRMLPMMLINLQEPIKVQVFGSLSCCRDAFKNVNIK